MPATALKTFLHVPIITLTIYYLKILTFTWKTLHLLFVHVVASFFPHTQKIQTPPLSAGMPL